MWGSAVVAGLVAGLLVVTAPAASAATVNVALSDSSPATGTAGSVSYVVGGARPMALFEIDWVGSGWGQGYDWAGGVCPASGFTVTVDGSPVGIHSCSGGTLVAGYSSWFGFLDSSAPAGSTVTVSWDSNFLTTPATPGSYQVGVWYAQGIGSLPGPPELWYQVDVGISAGGPKDLTVQQLAYTRTPVDATCKPGYGPSWAQWANGGTGGPVCVKYIYAFHPNETVK